MNEEIMKLLEKRDFISIHTIYLIAIIIFALVIMIFMVSTMITESKQREICEENEGVLKGSILKGMKCYTDDGIYEVIDFNGDWRLIK